MSDCKRCGVCCQLISLQTDHILEKEEAYLMDMRGVFHKRGWLVFKHKCEHLHMWDGLAACTLQGQNKPGMCDRAGCALTRPIIREAARFYGLIE